MALQGETEKQGIWLFKYRSTIPLVILVIGAVLLVLKELQPETFFIQESSMVIYYEMICLLVSLIGLGTWVYSVGHIPVFTPEKNTAGQIADSLNTTGIHSVVRHPLCQGNLFMWAGPALLTENWWFIVSFAFFCPIYYEWIMFAEKQFMRRSFGEIYTSWVQNVPALIPAFKNLGKQNLPFSWKTVIKKKKNGLTAIFLIFTAFDLQAKSFMAKRTIISF